MTFLRLRRLRGLGRMSALVGCFGVGELVTPLASSVSLPFVTAGAFAEMRSRVEAEGRSYGFGTVIQGDLVRHSFVIRNRGDAPLILQRVVPSCACTTAVVPAPEIPPGATGTLDVTFDTGGFWGEKEKVLRVFTSDVDDPVLSFSLRGRIERPVHTDPERIAFGEVVVGGDPLPSRRVTVTSPLGRTLDGLRVESLSPAVTVGSVVRRGREVMFDVSLPAELAPGELRERVVLTLPGVLPSPAVVPVTASVVAPFRLKPSKVNLGVLKDKKPIVRAVTLTNLGREPVRIVELRSDVEAVQGVVTERQRGKQFSIEIRIDPARVTSNLRGTITLVTDNKRFMELPIKVSGVVAPTL